MPNFAAYPRSLARTTTSSAVARRPKRTLVAMARGKVGNKPFRKAINFATEATEFDVLKNQDLLPLARDAGMRGLWLGIEDLTAGLVKKGQTVEKTKTLFKLLVKQGIAPMPMMMHHDGQPLWTLRSLYGLLNQVRFLWRAGAASCQVTLLTPWVGSQGYEQPFHDGLVLSKVGGLPIEQYQYDGNHCLATNDAHPWRRQINMLVSYAAFYNPLNLLLAIPRFDKVWADRIMFQLLGMIGLVKSIYQSRGWLARLIVGADREARRIAAGQVPHDRTERRVARACSRRHVMYVRDRIALDHLDDMEAMVI